MTTPSRDYMAALPHLLYEIVALADDALLLGGRDISGPQRNAYLEAELLHARVLAEFLLGTPRSDDIDRCGFSGGTDWTPGPAEAIERMQAAQLVTHKHLAHLTWERVNDGGKAWAYPQLAVDVLAAVGAWAEHVEEYEPKIAHAVRENVRIARGLLPAVD